MSKSTPMDDCAQAEAQSTACLDQWLGGQGWTTTPITNCDDQRNLGDRHVSRGQVELYVEYKCDQSRFKTIFAEWYADADTGKEGWAQYCHSDRLMYHHTTLGIVHSFDPNDLREYIQAKGGYEYFEQAGLVRTQSKNNSYRKQRTTGIVIDPTDLPSCKTITVDPLPYIGKRAFSNVSNASTFAYNKPDTTFQVIGCNRCD